MRYKKFLLGVIASVLCLGLLNGCSSYSHDFNSSEEAQKYILSKLKDKYNEEFIITEVKKYKEEKIGLNWIMAEVSSKENSSQTATIYTRNTGLFEDSYHVYYYSDEIKELATPLFQDKRNECIALFKQLEEVATEKDKEYIQNSIKFVQEQLEK